MCDVKSGCTCGNEYCAADSVLEDYIFPRKTEGKFTMVDTLPDGVDLPETKVIETKVLLPIDKE